MYATCATKYWRTSASQCYLTAFTEPPDCLMDVSLFVSALFALTINFCLLLLLVGSSSKVLLRFRFEAQNKSFVVRLFCQCEHGLALLKLVYYLRTHGNRSFWFKCYNQHCPSTPVFHAHQMASLRGNIFLYPLTRTRVQYFHDSVNKYGNAGGDCNNVHLEKGRLIVK